MRIEVESLDLDTQTIKTRNVDTGTTDEEAFDDLVIATGAEPVRPDLPGIDATGIFGVQTLDDGGAVIDYLNDRNPKSWWAVATSASKWPKQWRTAVSV